MSSFVAITQGTNTSIESSSHMEPFIQDIHSKVMDTIKNSDDVPGLDSGVFHGIKVGIEQHWNELVEKGALEKTATDREVRPYFVALQGIIEHVLACELGKSVQSLSGVIHTPMPATPLCTAGSISKDLVDESIENDPSRLFTVKARTTIIRDYLFQGGDLYVVYPSEGMKKREEAQKKIYQEELNNYPTHLFDCPLGCESIPTDLIGAFYLFKNREGKSFAFAIKMTQANSPQGLGSYGLWFGDVRISPVKDRITNVLDSISKYSSKPIASTLASIFF